MDIETVIKMETMEMEEKEIHTNLSHRRGAQHVLLLLETFLDY